MKKPLIYIVLGAALLTGCKHGNGNWTVSGTITNAENGDKIAMERFSGMGWIPVDSIEIDANGNFTYAAPSGMPSHDIFRLTYGNESIYFPIDTLDNVKVSADAASFGTSYTISGSVLADQMMSLENTINEAIKTQGMEYVLNDTDFRRNLAQAVLDDQTGVVAYYLINKKVGSYPLFSDSKKADVQVIGAVANRFSTLYPNDDRTIALERKFKLAKQNLRPGDLSDQPQFEAKVSGLIDLDLLDEKGTRHKLSEVAKDAGVTILNFTSYLGEFSPAYNVELNRLMEEFKGNDLAVYQVAFDGDEVMWRETARNLPWVTVLCAPTESQTVLLHYNVDSLPLAYVIDGNGDLTERITADDLSKDDKALEKAVRRALK